MPKQKDLKRLVRARMRKTGESYTAARASITSPKPIETPPPAGPLDLARVAGISDAAVKKRTGCTWQRWVEWLDRQQAHELEHKAIAKLIDSRFKKIGGWWAQTITVGYERIKGLREKGQRRAGSGKSASGRMGGTGGSAGGTYEVSKSRTLPVSVGALFAAFADAGERSRWLDLDLKVSTKTKDKSVRFAAADGTRVEAYFWLKGAGKCQVQLQHRKLASRRAAEAARAAWTERLDALARRFGAMRA